MNHCLCVAGVHEPILERDSKFDFDSSYRQFRYSCVRTDCSWCSAWWDQGRNPVPSPWQMRLFKVKISS
jgi:hypothetical protein